MNSKHNVEDETGMAKAEKDEVKKSNTPLTSPPTTSPKGHPTMAVYVAVTLQPDKKTLEPSKSKAKKETSPPAQETSSPKDPTDDKKGRSKEEPRDKVVNVVQMLIPTSPPPTPPVANDDKNLPPTDAPSKTPSKAPPNQVNVTSAQITFDEEDKYVKNILDGMEELSCGTLTDDDRTPAAAKTPPVFHAPEQVYSVEFVASSGQTADTFRQAQVLVAKEAFAKVTEKSPVDGQWLKELMAEAKPLLIRSLMHSQMLKPIVRTATIKLPERDTPIIAPPASVLAQQLMNSLITEVFDPAKMLEMHVAVRLPFCQTQPTEGPNYSVGIATTVKASEICSPVSCPDKVVCKSDTGKMAKAVYPTVLGGRPMLVDERFVDVIYRHMHMQENWETWSGQTGDRTPSAAQSIESYSPSPPPEPRSPPPPEERSDRKPGKTLTPSKASTTLSTTSTTPSKTSTMPSTTSTTRSTSSTLTPSTSSDLTSSTNQWSTSSKTSTLNTPRSSKVTSSATQSPITFPTPDRPSSAAIEKGRPPSEQIEEEMEPEGLEDVLRNYFEDSVDFENGTGVSKGIRTPPGRPSERSPQLSIITVNTPDQPKSLATSPEVSERGSAYDEERRRTTSLAPTEEQEPDLYYYDLISKTHSHGGWYCASCGFKKENGKPDDLIKRKKSSRNRRRK